MRRSISITFSRRNGVRRTISKPAVYNSIVNKTPLSKKSNIVIGGDAPSVILSASRTSTVCSSEQARCHPPDPPDRSRIPARRRFRTVLQCSHGSPCRHHWRSNGQGRRSKAAVPNEPETETVDRCQDEIEENEATRCGGRADGQKKPHRGRGAARMTPPSAATSRPPNSSR